MHRRNIKVLYLYIGIHYEDDDSPNSNLFHHGNGLKENQNWVYSYTEALLML